MCLHNNSGTALIPTGFWYNFLGHENIVNDIGCGLNIPLHYEIFVESYAKNAE